MLHGVTQRRERYPIRRGFPYLAADPGHAGASATKSLRRSLSRLPCCELGCTAARSGCPAQVTAKRVWVSSGELVQGLAAELIRRLMKKWDWDNPGAGKFLALHAAHAGIPCWG